MVNNQRMSVAKARSTFKPVLASGDKRQNIVRNEKQWMFTLMLDDRGRGREKKSREKKEALDFTYGQAFPALYLGTVTVTSFLFETDGWPLSSISVCPACLPLSLEDLLRDRRSTGYTPPFTPAQGTPLVCS